MKAILEFTLPEDQSNFNLARKAGEYHSLLHEIERYLRQIAKYGNPTKGELVIIDRVRELISETNIWDEE